MILSQKLFKFVKTGLLPSFKMFFFMKFSHLGSKPRDFALIYKSMPSFCLKVFLVLRICLRFIFDFFLLILKV